MPRPWTLTAPEPYATLPGMRALFLTSWYPSADQRQAGVFVREHALAAKSAGVGVAVVHLPDGQARVRGLWRLERERDETLTAGIPTFRLTSRQIAVPFSRKLSYWASYGLRLLALAATVRRLRRAGLGADVIHAHVYTAGAVAVAVRRLVRVPVVISEHSTAFTRRTLDRGTEKRARYAFARADRVLPVSECLRQAIEAYDMTGRFEVVSNAVDPAIFHPDAGSAAEAGGMSTPRRLLFVGGLEPTEHKGFPTLARALAYVAKTRPDWRLDVVGDGPSRAASEELIGTLDLADRVVFLGYRPKPEIAELMRGADAFVLPSRFETQGVVLLEAMMCGLPIVSTTAGAIPEVVPPDAGILVSPDDDAALAGAIEAVLWGARRFDGAAISAAATGRYATAVIGRRLLEVYESVVRG